MTRKLPRHPCQSTYCTNEAGYWHGRIVVLGQPSLLVAGMCQTCGKIVCSECAWEVEVAIADWRELSDATVAEVCRIRNVVPMRLHCRRCGTPLESEDAVEARLFIDPRFASGSRSG
jgi:hypothetical protein